jgi:hypothetical protein
MMAGSENSDLYQNLTKNGIGMLKEHLPHWQRSGKMFQLQVNMVPQLFLALNRTA